MRIMREPTITKAPPVAHEGIEANIGEKKTDTKNASPVNMAVRPVFPPSARGCKITISNVRSKGNSYR